MYIYINMADFKSAEDGDAHAEISVKNTIKVTEDQLSQEQKQAMARTIDGFKEAVFRHTVWSARGAR